MLCRRQSNPQGIGKANGGSCSRGLSFQAFPVAGDMINLSRIVDRGFDSKPFQADGASDLSESVLSIETIALIPAVEGGTGNTLSMPS